MQPSSSEISYMIYQCSIPNDLLEFTCDSHMLKVLTALDGATNLGGVAKKAGLPIKMAIAAAAQLLKYKLIEPSSDAAQGLSQEFMIYLHEQLSAAVGPIAEILVEDASRELGYTPDTLPAFKAAELVELLAQDIQRDDKRIAFQQSMVARIKKG